MTEDIECITKCKEINLEKVLKTPRIKNVKHVTYIIWNMVVDILEGEQRG
jgi:hypothetical protein